MTDVGIRALKEAIRNRQVDVPAGYSSHDLMIFITGYVKCQEDVNHVIDEFTKGQRD